MSEKKVGKRLLTWVLVLVMTLSLLPLNVLADEVNSPLPGEVTATKSCTAMPDEDGNYTITLTVQGNPVPSTDTMMTPANADVVLVVDNSGSMESKVGEPCETPKESFKAIDPAEIGALVQCQICGAKYLWPFIPKVCTGQKGKTPRITAAKDVSKTFADSILKEGSGNQIAIIGFSHGSDLGGIDENAIKVKQGLTNDIDAVKSKIDEMEADGGTNYTAALQEAYNYLNGRSATDKQTRPGYVIFISDGAPGLSGESQNNPKWNGSNQAASIKGDNYTLYTVGIALDDSAAGYLMGLASDKQDEHFINVTGTDYEAQLKDTLQQWATKITQTPTTKPAGTGAVLTDVINTEKFDYVAGNATGGLMVAEDNKTVTWEIGNIPKDEASVSFKIKPKAGVYGKDILTNDDVYLKYTDATSAEVTMGKNVIGDPTVNIPAPQVTLTFNANGGSWTAEVDGYTMGTGNTTASVTGELGALKLHKISTDPVRDNYDFTGWYEDAECTYPVAFLPIPLRANATLYAGWTPRQAEEFSCTIRQHFVDLTGESIIPPFTATAVAAGTPIADLIAAYASNQTWDELTYCYDASQTTVNGNPLGDGQTLTGNTVIDLYYYLDTWNDETNSTTEGDRIPDMYQAVVKFVSGNPLFGKVEGSNCTQVFTLLNSDGNYAVNGFVTPSLDGVKATPLNAAVHRFSMWTMNSGEISVKPTEPIPVNGGSTTVFKAQFEKIPTTYTVTYTDGVDGKAFKNQQYSAKYDEMTPAFVGTPTREGYEFLGWDPAVAKTVAGDATYTAKWEAKSYTVTYNSNGGTVVKPETVTYGNKATKPTNPTCSGYTFAGWYTDNEKFFNKYDFNTLVTGNIILYAKWTRNYTPRPYTPPTVVIPDDDALGLNTTDHFAYIVGYGNGEVRPQNNITRAEVATIFFRLLTDDVRDENLTKTNRYSDVAATSWYNTAVSTLSSMGIITGYPDGTFRPNAAITRAEFAAIAARFDNDGDKTAAKFSDIATHWAKDEISIAYNNGWITGYPDGTFGPQRDISRAETMTLVNRVLNRQPETEDDLLPNMTVWTDNANPKAWYYLAVQEATNSHYYKFKTNSKYEKWTELRETRDWTQLEK